jgi:hypothetical protein
MTLNKASIEDLPLVYSTKNYNLEAGIDNYGYFIVNKETGVMEAQVDQLPAAVFTLMSLQETFDEILLQERQM